MISPSEGCLVYIFYATHFSTTSTSWASPFVQLKPAIFSVQDSPIHYPSSITGIPFSIPHYCIHALQRLPRLSFTVRAREGEKGSETWRHVRYGTDCTYLSHGALHLARYVFGAVDEMPRYQCVEDANYEQRHGVVDEKLAQHHPPGVLGAPLVRKWVAEVKRHVLVDDDGLEKGVFERTSM